LKEKQQADKKLLSLRKKIYGLQTKTRIAADEHSQFAAVSDQLFDTVSNFMGMSLCISLWMCVCVYYRDSS
jgi:hypothetical protein